ncbi:MAG TPA: hypothetical protein VHB99_15755, partial [Pirellulales bacterium]|nr:hypothetical protein [Pirellulales bacterium]
GQMFRVSPSVEHWQSQWHTDSSKDPIPSFDKALRLEFRAPSGALVAQHGFQFLSLGREFGHLAQQFLLLRGELRLALSQGGDAREQ